MNFKVGRVAIGPRLPAQFTWNYDRTEIIADGVIHAIGVCFSVIGGIAIVLIVASQSTRMIAVAAVAVYAMALVAMLGVSSAYDMWPVCDTKWFLRRLDHSAIYLLIAGTYTPFIVQMEDTLVSKFLLAGVWLTAGLGVVLKLMLPGRFDRVAIVLYLLLGWCGVTTYGSFFALLPNVTFWLLAAGGVLYSMGVIFHVWERLRFQNAIWHAFVLCAAVCHYAAILGYVALEQTA